MSNLLRYPSRLLKTFPRKFLGKKSREQSKLEPEPEAAAPEAASEATSAAETEVVSEQQPVPAETTESMSELAASKLFEPLRLGVCELKHRVIMAPMTRVRSPEHIPTDMVKQYYEQRASDGGLIISEGLHPSVMAGNFPMVPGIYTPEQRRAWKTVTDAVHSKGGFIFAQLWHVGRATHPVNIGGKTPLCSAANLLDEKVMVTIQGPQDPVVPKEMTESDIRDTIEDFVHAARTAIEAGFDGVEIHGANGYLLDQFIVDSINTRTDSYGGSPENRARFPFELVKAVCEAIGAGRVGLRLSPFNVYNNPVPTKNIIGDYGLVMEKIDPLGIAYVHIIEPRFETFVDSTEKLKRLKDFANDREIAHEKLAVETFRPILKNTKMITNGAFSEKDAAEPFTRGLDAVAFGKWFISNPDLPAKLKSGTPLKPYDFTTFYTQGAEGYIDYAP